MNGESIPEYLEKALTGAQPSPPVDSAAQVLPFDQLGWENFERLCYRLAHLEGEPQRVQLFGTRGQNQSGIDIFSRERDGYVVYQCKRVASLTASELRRAVDRFLEGDWREKARRFVFCTSHSSVETKIANEVETQANRLLELEPPVELDVWDAEELSVKLKEHPELVTDFFGSAWLARFAPGQAAAGDAAALAQIQESVQRIEQATYERVRIVLLDWAPGLIKRELQRLTKEAPETIARLEDHVGIPPEGARVEGVVRSPPKWLSESNERVWQILAMAAERGGDWTTARQAWEEVAKRASGDDKAGYLVAAAVAADIGGDASMSQELLGRATEQSPRHPRVLLQHLDQNLSGEERLKALASIESDDPTVGALVAAHKAAAYMLLPDVDEARAYVEEAERLNPKSAVVRAVRVNLEVQQGRIAVNEHRSVDYHALVNAHREAVAIREQLLTERRYEESVRILMLAADSLGLVAERDRALELLHQATSGEMNTPAAAEVLGDAALRSLGFREALAIVEDSPASDAIDRIRASASVEIGPPLRQREGLETLDRLIAEKGPEAPQAAIFRLGVAVGRKDTGWAPDAAALLRERGYFPAEVTAEALYLARHERDFVGAEELLEPYRREIWANLTRMRIAMLREDGDVMREAALEVLAQGPPHDDRVQCGEALAMAGEAGRAREVLVLAARDPAVPPAIRADAYALLIPLVGAKLEDWGAAADLHAEWVKVRPADTRASVWAPTIANRLSG